MIKLVAVLCRLAAPYDCHDETVTNALTMGDCMVAVKTLAGWAEQFPAYRVGGWKCQLGSKATEREA